MRSPQFPEVLRLLRLAVKAEARNQTSEQAVESSRAERRAVLDKGKSRRDFIVESSRLAALAAGASVLDSARVFAIGRAASSPSVGIVGAGLAGMACADALQRKGIVATVYEASSRVGGRCYSLRNFFPGQVAERGGEFIDNPHKTMLRYAKELKLSLEDVTKLPGDVFYYFNGQHYDESEIVEAFRDFVPVMHDDLRRLSGEVTAFSPTPDDLAIDRTSLAEYLAGSNSAGVPASPLARVVIEEAYKAEYGLEPDEQSALNFLMFIHADRRSKFTPFGVSSDERWHIVEGNDRIPNGLAGRLGSAISFDMTLVAVRRTAAGRIELTFESGRRTITRVHDTAVITVPFSVLRDVQLDSNLSLAAGQQLAIDTLGYGTNAKMMVGFDGQPWTNVGSNGTAYASLPNVQTKGRRIQSPRQPLVAC
jgi:monoamine oxidase